jgi:hypothetical protein
MRTSLRTTVAAVVTAALVTACGSSPLEPVAPTNASAQPQNLHGFVVNWGQKAPAPDAAQPQNLHGFVVNWGQKAPAPAPAAAQPQNLHGFVVNWGNSGTN